MRRGAISTTLALGMVFLFLAVAGLTPGVCTAANPFNSEFQVNTTTSESQYRPAMARLASGGFVVSWTSWVYGTETADIKAQVYNNDAVRIGGEITVASSAPKAKMTAVAPVSGGGFVVLWDVWTSDSNGYDIHARFFDSQGNASTETMYLATSDANDFLPRATGLENGNFALVWNSAAKDSTADGNVLMRMYDSQGNGVSDLRQANSARAHRDSVTCVVGLPGSGCMVFWDGIATTSDGWNVTGQRYNSSGEPQSDNFTVNKGITGIQWNPAATALSTGKVVVVWVVAKDESLGDIHGRVFNSEGAAQTADFVIASDGARDNTWPSVAALEGEDFVAVWDAVSSGDGEGRDIRGQRLYGQGNLFQDQFRVNSQQSGDQDYPVIVSRNGGYVVVWESYGQDGDGYGVYGQMYY